MPHDAEAGYTETAVSGVAWQGIIGIAIRVLRSVVFLVLARLVLPESFGVIALAGVFTTVLRHLTGGGFSQAIIQQPKLTKAHLDTALHVSLAVGAILTGILLVTAGAIADVMGEPDLRFVLAALAIMPLLAGVSCVPEGLLSREMKFRQLSIRHLIAAGASTATALAMALAGFGVWALVAQTLTETVVSCAVLWWALRRRYRPGLQVSRHALADLAGYGFKVVGTDLLLMISTCADDFLIGAFLGTRQLGLYSVAYRLLTILQETLQGVSESVAFPLYARLQDQPDRLAKGFRRASRLNLAIAAPIFLYAAAAAPQIVPLALGDQWMPAAPVMTALALSGVASVVMSMNTTLMGAKGHAGRVLVLTLINACLSLAGFAVAVQFGIVWVAIAFTIRSYLLLPVSIHMVSRYLGDSRAVVRGYMPILACLIVPVVAGIGAQLVETFVGTIAAVAASGVVGAALYVAAMRWLAHDCYLDMIMIASRLIRRGRRSV